jgi:hypothetical protein
MSRLLLLSAIAVVAIARAELPPSLPFEWTDWAASMKKEPTKGLDLGNFRIEFEKTTLSDVQRAVAAGTVNQAGDAAERSLWLCYSIVKHRIPERVWIISDGEMGGDTHVVTGITATRTGTAPSAEDCPRGGSAS